MFEYTEKVVCGYMHALALSDEGVLYVWGANSYGQLGLNTDSNVWLPTKVKIYFVYVLLS